MTATVDDPIRAEVERVLHALVGTALAAPARAATVVPRCVRRNVERVAPLAEPWRLARSLFELVASGGRREPAASPAAAASPRAVPDDGAADEAVSPPGTAEADATDVQLPIEDYESLAASQVVDRLPTLTPAELQAVRRFEAAHRGRRTVLGRIEQLLA